MAVQFHNTSINKYKYLKCEIYDTFLKKKISQSLDLKVFKIAIGIDTNK